MSRCSACATAGAASIPICRDGTDARRHLADLARGLCRTAAGLHGCRRAGRPVRARRCLLGGYLALGMARAAPERIDGLMLTAPVVRGRGQDRTLPPRLVLRRDAAVDDLCPDETLWASMAVVRRRDLEAFRQGVKPAGRRRLDVPEDPRVPVRGQHRGGPPPRSLAGACARDPRQARRRRGLRRRLPLLADLPRGTFAVLDGAGHGVEEDSRSSSRTSRRSGWTGLRSGLADGDSA